MARIMQLSGLKLRCGVNADVTEVYKAVYADMIADHSHVRAVVTSIGVPKLFNWLLLCDKMLVSTDFTSQYP